MSPPFSARRGRASPTDCEICPAGSFCAAGSTNHTQCAPGSFSSTDGSSKCTQCPSPNVDGTREYQADSGQTACTLCGAGNYSANILSCLPCPIGEYCEQGVQTGVQCGFGLETLAGKMTTLSAGATRQGDCVCKLGRVCHASPTTCKALGLYIRVLTCLGFALSVPSL